MSTTIASPAGSFQIGLGRLSIPDDRDRNFPVRAALPPEEPERVYRYWNSEGWWGDQGPTSQCVAYSWLHWLEDGPVTQPASPHGGPTPVQSPSDLYREAQKVDQWPGENYEGTSVRAGAKVLQDRGYIGEYRWAFSVEEVVQSLLHLGPVVVGTVWTRNMTFPDMDGFLQLTGPIVGGHAYLLNGVNVEEEKVRLKNSWGRAWGRNGSAWLRFADLELLLGDDGEACVATEIRQP